MTPTRLRKVEPSLFTDFFGRDFFNDELFDAPQSAWTPSANVKESSEAYHLEMAVPGIQKEDIRINVEEDVLHIEGKHSEEKNEKEERYSRREFSTSSFSRSFRLPKTIEKEAIDAKYENGILRLTLPKREEVKSIEPKEIRVS